ncbi:MAG: adenylyl-sulfate kinase, partial [Candidatus Helarchaeota archaeon]
MVDGGFVEIYLRCDVEECIKRDVKGLWDRALKGEIKNWPGVDVEYEEGKPEIEIINNDESEIKNNVEKIMEYLDNCLVTE